MYAIEKDNPKLEGKLPRDYARCGISSERLGGLIDQIASIAVGTKEAQRKDILGRVYEYFLGKFAAAEGKLGGEFFTPSSIVRASQQYRRRDCPDHTVRKAFIQSKVPLLHDRRE
jgi:type I restriction enzyme M protein